MIEEVFIQNIMDTYTGVETWIYREWSVPGDGQKCTYSSISKLG